ncbi:hypothetical protein MIR68_004897 [Amoeboaphelidium protococcarum]|nr:hypothetical protein MIR68_004897 [Amoeboaphelidium protococcarum]KAI3653311.1 hypothetical protein MP228_001258 [Amoeboaphelidium protococcarum]
MFYALLFSWLVLWANCFFPAIQSMRVGAFMKSDINAVLHSGDFINDKHVFNCLMNEMTGGDKMVIQAIKQMAKNTMDGVSFSLDPIIEHAKQMAPIMVENSRQMVSRFTQGASYADASQRLVHFVTQATGSSYEAEQVLDILDSAQHDPRESTHRLIRLMSETNGFVADCIAKSRSLLNDGQRVNGQPDGIAPYNNLHRFEHQFDHPIATYRHLAIVSIVIAALWFTTVILQCLIGNNTVCRRTLGIYRVLAVTYCLSYLFILLAITGHLTWFIAPFIIAPIVIIYGALEWIYALQRIPESDA